MIAHVDISCIELFVTGETHFVFASSVKLPSFAKLVFSADSNLGDGVVAVAMQEITCEEKLQCIGWSMVSDGRHQDIKGISCC